MQQERKSDVKFLVVDKTNRKENDAIATYMRSPGYAELIAPDALPRSAYRLPGPVIPIPVPRRQRSDAWIR